MRPQKRSRGRNGGGNPYHNNNQNRGPRPPHRIQTFDSNGPNVKIRGNAYQVFERYLALAREAQSSGDRVAAENFYQHAEHYFRVMNANGEGFGQGQPRPQQTPNEGGFQNGGEGEQPDVEQVHVQQTAPLPQPVIDEGYTRELDDSSAAADRQPDRGNDEDQLPSFITRRPE
jgi:hypothetical protein